MKLRNIMLSLATVSAVVSIKASTPDYIFYFIGDGMGIGPVQAAQNYSNEVLGDTTRLNMYSMPVFSIAMTRSVTSPVTDSAAAGTALATGYKTCKTMVGVTPDTVAVTSIASMLHDQGWGIGVVTTVAPDDATPASFYAHVPSRYQSEKIGRQFIESDFEFLAGSSLRGAKHKNISTGVMEAIDEAGIAVTYSPDSVALVDSRRCILLNRNNLNDGNVGHHIDSVAPFNTLPQMTQAAIDHLSKVSPDKFFIAIEAGNIDHALHANDAATAILEILSLDKSIGLALDFMKAHPDNTLIVVTADHDTGGLTIGNEAVGYDCFPAMLLAQKASKDRLNGLFTTMMNTRRIYQWEDIKDFLKEHLSFFDTIEITPEEEADLRATYEDVVAERAADQRNLYSSVNAFVAKAVDLLNSKAGYGFTTRGHTGNPVPVVAAGKGAEIFSSVSDNTELPKKIMQLTVKPTE